MPFDFAAVTAPFRMQPGLRRLAAGAAQLTPSRVGDAAFTEKLATLRWHHEEALLAAPGFDAGPGLRALIEHAAREQPDALIWDGDGALTAPHLGWSLRGDEVCPAEVHSNGPADIGHTLAALPVKWRAAGLLSLAFAEDFALLDGTTACIPWLAVCLPSHWAPQDKVGRHFVEVHAPVADSQLLLTAADHLARLVTGAERWERFVWTLTGEPHLRMHPRHLEHRDWPGERCGTELAAHTFFRTERQTFIPIPGLQQAVFTIHVETRPLTQALATPAQARQLHDALASMSPAVLAYRGLSAAQPRLLAWLADQFGAPLP